MAVGRFTIMAWVNKWKLVLMLLIIIFSALSFTNPFANTVARTSNRDLQLLGRYLFYDTRLSYNQTKSCASCHDPSFAFSDGYRTSVGADGYPLKRNAPSLLNAISKMNLTWADSTIKDLNTQLNFPFFNQHPKELGWNNEQAIVNRLENIDAYRDLFKKVFSAEKKPIHLKNIFSAIIAFEATIVSKGSLYDAYIDGNKSALTTDQQVGMKLFFSEQLKCGHCHSWDQLNKPTKARFENIGLYNINNTGNYPDTDQGLFDISKKQSDKGKFRVPSLRNVLLTAPYTHDGTVSTIEEMIDIYVQGGRFIQTGELMGDGRINPYKTKLVQGFVLSKKEKQQLIAFLNSFTDTSYMQNKKLLFVALN
jgi:cytochrome c peroxidase